MWVAGVQSRDYTPSQRGPPGHWCLVCFFSLELLPGALLLVEGGWESQCSGSLEGGHPAWLRMWGCLLVHYSWTGLEDQRTSGAHGTLWQGVVVKVSVLWCLSMMMWSTWAGRVREKNSLRCQNLLCGRLVLDMCPSGPPCRFLQFIAAIAVTTSSGTRVNRIQECHPAAEPSRGCF